MSKTKEPARAKRRAFIEAASSYYDEAFSVRGPQDLARSMADWSELTRAEQSFAVAHLSWLGLQAQADTQRLLVQIRNLLEEVAEGIDVLGRVADQGAEGPTPAIGDGDEVTEEIAMPVRELDRGAA